jgi:hypothetical protein
MAARQQEARGNGDGKGDLHTASKTGGWISGVKGGFRCLRECVRVRSTVCEMGRSNTTTTTTTRYGCEHHSFSVANKTTKRNSVGWQRTRDQLRRKTYQVSSLLVFGTGLGDDANKRIASRNVTAARRHPRSHEGRDEGETSADVKSPSRSDAPDSNEGRNMPRGCIEILHAATSMPQRQPRAPFDDWAHANADSEPRSC